MEKTFLWIGPNETYKYLGIHRSLSLNWEMQQEECIRKVGRQLNLIKQKHFNASQTVGENLYQPGSTWLKPHLALLMGATIENQLATLEHEVEVLENGDLASIVFTDGSFDKESGRGAVAIIFWQILDHKNYKDILPGIRDNVEAELLAIGIAIRSVPITRHLVIYTDCEAFIKLLRKFQSEWLASVKKNFRLRDGLERQII
jgi:hypothetical protein